MARQSLRRQVDFDRVFANGRRRKTAPLTVIVAPRPEANSPARLGVIVSKRVSRLAVVRNRVRRRVREAFRALQPQMITDADVIVIAHRPLIEYDYWAIKAQLQEALTRLGMAGDGSGG